MNKAIKIMRNIDIKDAPFVAALLAIDGDGILSYDTDFQSIETLGYKFLRPEDIIQ